MSHFLLSFIRQDCLIDSAFEFAFGPSTQQCQSASALTAAQYNQPHHCLAQSAFQHQALVSWQA